MTDLHPIHFTAYAPTIDLDRETRTIRGTIIAYGIPTTDYRRIVIHAGALRPRLPLSRVKLLIDHDQKQPVGFMTELDADALNAAFKVPDGDAGDKALKDAQNGLRDGLSVGIQVLDEDGAFAYDETTRTYHVYAAELVEVSLCAIPAYQDAEVTHVAASHQTAAVPTPKENNTVDPETLTLEQVEEALSTASDDIERRVEQRLASFTPAPAPTAPSFTSFGAFVKALAGGDTDAADYYKTLALDGTTADDYKRPAWVQDKIHLVEARRRILNTFTTETLPERGMTLEYAKLKSNTTKVEKQAKEGAALAKGKIQLETATANVETYGGASEVSIQTVKRANAAYLDTLFKALAIEYARTTEAAARAGVTAAITAQKATDAKLTLPANATAYDWLDLLIDAADMYDDLGFDLTGTLVSKDVFKKLARLEDTGGNMLMKVTGEGVNRVGSIDVAGIKGDIASISFKLFHGAAEGTASFYDPIAFTTWESAGAPFRLQQENVLNLTEAFSLYGFAAFASQFPTALVPVEFAQG